MTGRCRATSPLEHELESVQMATLLIQTIVASHPVLGTWYSHGGCPWKCSVLDVLQHHSSELLVRNLTVAVLVNLLDDLLYYCFVQVLTKGEHLLDLVSGDGTTAVLVEHFEGRV